MRWSDSLAEGEYFVVVTEDTLSQNKISSETTNGLFPWEYAENLEKYGPDVEVISLTCFAEMEYKLDDVSRDLSNITEDTLKVIASVGEWCNYRRYKFNQRVLVLRKWENKYYLIQDLQAIQDVYGKLFLSPLDYAIRNHKLDDHFEYFVHEGQYCYPSIHVGETRIRQLNLRKYLSWNEDSACIEKAVPIEALISAYSNK